MSEQVRGSLETTRHLARDGDPIAQFQLGEKLNEWDEYDHRVAWYRKSAKQCYAPAQHKLSQVLMDEAAPLGRLDVGQEKIGAEAVEWNARARAQGHSPAIYALAESYRYGNKYALELDLTKAIELHKEAAKAEYPVSLYALGVIYLAKNGNHSDIDYAISCLITAANSGLKVAQKALARAFAGGQPGVPQNVSMAREWLRQAENNTGRSNRDMIQWLIHS